MKLTKITSAALVAAMVASSAVAAEGDYYGSVAAGMAGVTGGKFTDLAGNSAEFKAISYGFTGVVGLGYHYSDAVRADVTFGFSPSVTNKIKGSSDKAKLSSYTGLVNVYYDFTGMAVVPYVTAGVGATSQSFKFTSGEYTGKFKRKTGFAYQAGLGLGYEVASGIMLDVGYRYTGSSVKMKGKDELSALKVKFNGAHSVLAGLRFSF